MPGSVEGRDDDATRARRSTPLIEPDRFIELARTYIGWGGV
jgi:hypothetical protein